MATNPQRLYMTEEQYLTFDRASEVSAFLAWPKRLRKISRKDLSGKK